MAIFNRNGSKDFIEHLSKAQTVRFNIKHVFDVKSYDFVSFHSSALGCAKQLILFPLLAAVASCMGKHTTVKVNSDWQENIILWILLAARSGEKKTPALNKLKEAVKGIEAEIHALSTAQNCDKNIHSLEERLLIDNSNIFSLGEYAVQSLDTHKIFSHLVMLDNFGAFLSSDENIPGNFLNRPSSLIDMYEGLDMTVGDDNRGVFKSHVNFVAMMKGRDAITLLNTDDPDGFLDRTLLACPCSFQEGFSLDTYGRSTGKNIPSLQSLLSSVRNFHSVQEVTYTFSPDGEEHFERCLQKLQVMSNATLDDERCRGSVHKAPGQIVRLAAVLTALQSGLVMATEGGLSQRLPSKVINKSVVESAYCLVKYSLDQKFAIYGKSAVEPELTSEDDVQIVEEPESTWKDESTSSSTVKTDKITTSSYRYEQPAKKMRTKTVSGDELIINSIGFRQYPTTNGNGIFQSNTICASFNGEQSARFVHLPKVPSQDPRQTHFDSIRFGQHCTEPISDLTNTEQNVIEGSGKFNNEQTNFTYPFQEDTNNEPCESIDHTVNTKTSIDHMQNQQYCLEQPTPNQIFVNQTHAVYDERVVDTCARDRLPDVYEFDDETFIGYCAPKIRKLLLTRGSMVTAAFACQYRLFPPVPRSQRRTSMKTTHPVWAAGKFFERIERLGLGIVISRRGMSIRLRKKRLEDLDEAGKELLNKINLMPEEYEKSYPKTMGVSHLCGISSNIMSNTESFPFSQPSHDARNSAFSMGHDQMQTSMNFLCKVENP